MSKGTSRGGVLDMQLGGRDSSSSIDIISGDKRVWVGLEQSTIWSACANVQSPLRGLAVVWFVCMCTCLLVC